MTTPVFLSPALPSELLSYILNNHVYPTTLIICYSRAEFLATVVEDIQKQSRESVQDSDKLELHEGGPSQQAPRKESRDVEHILLSSPLYQVAISRHIRMVYIPTVTHLRAYLSVFSPDESLVTAPPPAFTGAKHRKPHLLLYGFLELHRDTSEWSAQGLSNTTAALIEVAHRLSWQALVIEPRGGERGTPLENALRETVPILSGGARRLGLDSDEGAWTGRTVEVGRILSRWFSFQRAQWDTDDGPELVETTDD
ncbi:hypothetical protein F5Y19DRAFT_364431 [Xylariaceae sp. FL1651]|nr:hypothetical protein F5Y19DRAFT_364431 [Xylariaceae sp. FL1651]